MNKPMFKVLDEKGRVLIPKALRACLGIASGDVVSITVNHGSISIKKAIVVDSEKVPMEAKIAYAETVAREMDDDALTNLLELAVQLLKERKSKP